MVEMQLQAARREITHLSEENNRFRAMLTQLTSEYHNLQMYVAASMQHCNGGSSAPAGTHNSQFPQVHKMEAESRPESGAASPERLPSATSLPGHQSPTSPDTNLQSGSWQGNKVQKISHNGVMNLPSTSLPITQVEADSNFKKARVSVRARSDAPTVTYPQFPS